MVMRRARWVSRALNPSYNGVCGEEPVGWVERSETHYLLRKTSMGFPRNKCGVNQSYNNPSYNDST
jgi:hypothetical protein